MLLGIEIGGTKLQLGVSQGDDRPLAALQRLSTDPDRGAEGVLNTILAAAERLTEAHKITAIGVGFGGPVDAASGCVIRCNQVNGWGGFPLRGWFEERFGVPTTVLNDCDAAALAEARHGAGRGLRSVLYITVGSGIGGGLVFDGQLFGQHRPAVAEIGQLRVCACNDARAATVESLASGWGIAARARLAIRDSPNDSSSEQLTRLCQGNPQQLTAKMVGQAARDGDPLSRQLLDTACRALGRALGHAICMLAPEVIVIGGGVTLLGEDLFFGPLRQYVNENVYEPLIGSYAIVTPRFGELVVVHGGLTAAGCASDTAATTLRASRRRERSIGAPGRGRPDFLEDWANGWMLGEPGQG